jgi:hypothetical protein
LRIGRAKDKSRFLENRNVLGNGGWRKRQNVSQVTEVACTIGRQVTQQLDAGRMGQRFAKLGHFLGIDCRLRSILFLATTTNHKQLIRSSTKEE